MESAPYYRRGMIAAHTLVIYTWTIVSTIVLGSLAISISLFSGNSHIVHHVARIWGRGILWVSGIRVTMNGLDRIDAQSSYVYMANHQSQFDIPVLLSALPVQFRWLAKAELFKIPIFGRGMRGAGYISIDRSDRKSAFKSLDRAARSIREGSSVMIFPEGTRSPDGQLLPFKKGGFVLAVDAGVPIVPVIIHGAGKTMPKGSLLIRSGTIHIELLTPIPSSEYSRKTKNELLLQVRTAMENAIKRASAGGAHA